MTMKIVEVGLAGPLLDAAFADVLAPAFPPDELTTAQDLRHGVGSGDTSVVALVDDENVPHAVAVGEFFSTSQVVLLAYLATRPGGRSTGLGGRLLAHVVDEWTRRWDPRLMVAEIEHPAAHAGNAAYGDPTARVRFYARHGVRPLDLPYFQPPVASGQPRVYGLMLCTLAVGDQARGAEPETVDPGVVSSFLVEYLQAAEGSVGPDPAVQNLLEAARRPDGVRLLSFDSLDAVPCSVAPDTA
jgi:GNAT superfamily N-acetyltransferase